MSTAAHVRRRTSAALIGCLLGVLPLTAAFAMDDPYRPQQWGLERIGAPSAWAVARGAGQVVAVIDSGVDLGHPDLVDRLFRDAEGNVIGRDIVDGDDTPQDDLGHGTMVAGVIAATEGNGIGVAGVAPDAAIMPVRVLDEDGSGTSRDVDAGIRWAVDNGATVVNLSLESAIGLPGQDLVNVSAPTAAVQYAWDNGVVVVAAAGNSGSPFTDYPSSSPVVLVGATDRDDDRADFSDTGREDLLMAPGVDIVSTWCRPDGSETCDPQTHNYGIADGTSFAAPHVAGAIAVLRSLGLDAPGAVERLRSTTRDIGSPGPDRETGQGLIDLAVAASAGGPAPTPTDTDTPTSSPTPTETSTPAPTPSAEPSTAPPSLDATPDPDPSTATPTPTATATDTDAPVEPSSPSEASPPDEPSSTPTPTRAAELDPADGRGVLPWVASALVAVTAGLVAREARRA